MIFAAFDKPEWVHEFLNILLDKKLAFIEESLKGAKFDLIETGGGVPRTTLYLPKYMKNSVCLMTKKYMML